MSKHPPRSIFRSRRHRPPPYYDPLLDAARKARMQPGTLTWATIWHRADCPRPQGGKCKCRPHEIDVELSPFDAPKVR
jgi:hypothetical protein